MKPVFHLSLSVSDLAASQAFYEAAFEARVGRRTERWLDLWLFGAQVTVYHRPKGVVPSPYREAQHFGASVAWDEWRALAERLTTLGVSLPLAPHVDEDAGVAKLMAADPDGYLIEIKAYKDPQAALQRPQED